MVEFFRHCPGCGRRFHIKLVEKDELSSYDTGSKGPILGRVRTRGAVARGVANMEEGGTLIFDTEEFAYHYKCKHCGHEWTETRLEDKPVGLLDPIND